MKLIINITYPLSFKNVPQNKNRCCLLKQHHMPFIIPKTNYASNGNNININSPFLGLISQPTSHTMDCYVILWGF